MPPFVICFPTAHMKKLSGLSSRALNICVPSDLRSIFKGTVRQKQIGISPFFCPPYVDGVSRRERVPPSADAYGRHVL